MYRGIAGASEGSVKQALQVIVLRFEKQTHPAHSTHCLAPSWCHCVHAPASRASCEHARNQIAKWCFLLLWFGILEPSWNHAEESPDRNPGMKRSLKSPAGTMSWVAPSVSRFVSSRIDTSCTSFLSCSSTYQLSQWYFHSVKMCQMCQMCPWLELKDRSGNTQLLAFVASKSCWCGHFRKMCGCFKDPRSVTGVSGVGYRCIECQHWLNLDTSDTARRREAMLWDAVSMSWLETW